ncbi:MAG: PspC domain-containing protein [Bacteroidales bacterium]
MNQPRKFFRSTTDRYIGGVCGGLADYFNVDPSLVRVAFVAAFFVGLGGFFIYIILWIVTPER